jgi:hypothetical protein
VGKRDFKEEEENKDMVADPIACSCYNEERIVVVCRSSVKSIVVGKLHPPCVARVHAHLHVARDAHSYAQPEVQW